MSGSPRQLLESRAADPRENPITASEYRRRCLPVRIALALAALAAVLGLAGGTMDVVSGMARGGGDPTGVGAPGELLVALVVGGALAAAAAAVPRLWAHLVGLLGATAVSFATAGAVVGARSSERLVAEVNPAIERGGALLIAAFALGTVTLLAALAALRRIAQDPEEGTGGDRPEPGIATKATVALALGVLSLIIPPLAGLAIAMGTLAHGDIRRSHNQLEGLGRALAGSILGTFVLVLVILAGIAGVAIVRPSG